MEIVVRWSIKSLVAVAVDSAGFVASVHLQEEVPGVMGLEVQSDQQEEDHGAVIIVTTNTALSLFH